MNKNVLTNIRKKSTLTKALAKIFSLKKTLKELLNYKSISEAKMNHHEEELKAVKSQKVKENVVDTSLVSKTEQLGVDFEKLKSEFELLKLCQRNQLNKKVERKIKRPVQMT